MDALVVELREKGTITLPESIRQDLPPGTRFLVLSKKNRIVLQAVRNELSTQFDLSKEAFEFTNDLIAEERLSGSA
jgi:hypothetical protein